MTNTKLELLHGQTVRALAPECAVWLKKDGTFPLDAPEKLALYGSGARHTQKGGTGSGDVNVRHTVSIEEGLWAGGFTVTTQNWLDSYDNILAKAKADFIKSIKEEARRQRVLAVMLGMGAVMGEPDYDLPLFGEGDLGVYVLGRVSGEGNDRKVTPGDFCLTETEIRDILQANRQYRRFCLVLNVGGQVDLTPVMEVKNILLLSQLGAETGHVLSDLLLGKAYPSGKLSQTWAPYSAYPEALHFGHRDNTYYGEGMFVGYRYFSSFDKPVLFPFGYGLGYTDFSLEEKTVKKEQGYLTVSAKVANVGAFSGKETVQIYASAPCISQPYPKLALCAFQKTNEIAAGKTETVTLRVDLADLAGHDKEGKKYFLEKGVYRLYIGFDSRALLPLASLEAKEEILLWETDTKLKNPDVETIRPDAKWQNEAFSSDIPAFPLLAEDVAHRQKPTSHLPDEEALQLAKKLSVKELITLCVGYHKKGPDILSVIGNASKSVAGAAGETADGVAGLPALVMADGPAGLRLSKEFWKDKKGGVHPIGETMPEGITDFLPDIANAVLGLLNRKNPRGRVMTQYTTAIPIGTAIAQSFSPSVAEAMGDIVGREMEQFGIDLWLAPAINIQRSPLCGRNFEYYSEDPYLTAKIAVGMVKGVQSHPQKGVTVKHFCVNNQETNRYQSSSEVDVRALRDIYLRAFETVVREESPAAIMTSYNLLCGIHTAEHEGLLKGILRGEWGYEGLVMSDWILITMKDKRSIYPTTKPAPSLKAGNDLFMPGCSGDVRAIKKALKGKGITHLKREDLEYCASHIIALALRKRNNR